MALFAMVIYLDLLCIIDSKASIRFVDLNRIIGRNNNYMNVTDYNSKLSSAKADFNEMSEKLRDSYKGNEKHLENVHKNDKQRQQDVYMKERQEMKDTFNKLSTNLDDISKEQIQQETKRYIHKNEEQLHDFNIDKKNTKRGYDKKLANIKNSFDSTLKERSLSFDHDVKNAQKLFEERLSNLKTSKDDTVRRINLSSSDNISEIRDESDREKLNIQLRNQSTREELIKDGQSDAAEKRDMQTDQIKNIKFSNEQSHGMLKKHHEEKLQQINNQKEADSKMMRNNIEDLTDKLTDKFDADKDQAKKETKSLLMNKDRDQARAMQALRNESKAKIRGGTRLDNQNDKEQRVVDGYENRLKHLKNKLEEVKYQNQENKLRINQKIQSQIANSEIIGHNKIEDKNEEIIDYKENAVKKSKQDMEKTLDSYKTALTSTKQEQVQQGMNSSEKSKRLLNSQRMEYSRSIIDMQQKNDDLLTDLQDKTRRDNSAFIENTRKKTHFEKEDLKHDLREHFSRKEDSLNKRLDSSIKQNMSITDRFENKLENVKKKSAEEIQNIRLLTDERRQADRRTFRREFGDSNKQKQLELAKLKGSFERQLSKSKLENDKQNTKLIRKYESQLSNERKDHQRTMVKKLEIARTDYQRLYSHSELEKETLRNQFEIQMANLRQTFQEQAEKAVDNRTERMSKS
jgi:hypothetical protein